MRLCKTLPLLLLSAACSSPEGDCAPVCEAVTACAPGAFAKALCESECLVLDAAGVDDCGACLQGASCAEVAEGRCDPKCQGFSFARSCRAVWPAGPFGSEVRCHALANGMDSCDCRRDGASVGNFASTSFCGLTHAKQQSEAAERCNLDGPGGGELHLAWTFAGERCALTPEVTKVVASLTGPKGPVALAPEYVCSDQGLTLEKLPSGEYSWEVSGRDTSGRTLYRASGTLSHYRSQTLAADLQPVP